MSRWEFMRQLEQLLSDISPSEREEALQYYNDYFNDAGKENEAEVMGALGSPEQVAQIVKDGLSDNGTAGEFTENGFTSIKKEAGNEMIKKESVPFQNQTGDNAGEQRQTVEEAQDAAREEKKQKGDMPTWAIVLIVIACIFLSPVILGVAAAAATAVLSIILAMVAVVFGFGAAAVILFVAAVLLWIAGFSCLFGTPIGAVSFLGGGCVCAGIGILFLLLTVFIAGKCIPGIFQGIAYICRKLFGKKEGQKL